MSLKRAIDIALGTLLAAVATPLILVFALALVVELWTWPFFFQLRLGRGQELFRMPKLRTLPRLVAPYTSKDSFSDLKIPFFSRFLRRSHLDELPQLFLVPLGRMSLVGPRPKMPDWAEPIDRNFGSVRTLVRPGCTGLWQIGRHTHLPVAKCSDYDYFYLRNACLRLDLWILWRTLLIFFGTSRRVLILQVPRWVCRQSSPWPFSLEKARREHPAGSDLRERTLFNALRNARS
jgi:lipopolysaccharide/colanic/teichoic acid biosynthesis glycosyltransferase